MKPEDLLRLGIVCGVIGFGAFGASHAFQVWRARNAVPGLPHNDALSTIARWSKVALGLGLLCAALAFGFRLTVARDGVLEAHGLFTLRVPEGMQVDAITAGEMLEPGAFLGRFLKVQVDPDPELVRQELEVTAERRHLESVLELTITERDQVGRESLRHRLDSSDLMSRLEQSRLGLAADLAQAEARLQFAKQQLESTEALYKSSGLSELTRAEKQKDVEILTTESMKIRSQLTRVEQQKADDFESIHRFDQLVGGQYKEREQQSAALNARRMSAIDREQAAKSALSTELARVNGTLADPSTERDAVRGRTVTALAPFAGRTVYLNPSPKTAYGPEPLLVLAPPQAFRMRARLPVAEAGVLAGAGPITIEWLDRGVERRFSGQFAESRTMANDPGYAVVEVVCDPPAETVRDLATGEKIRTRLHWMPPIHALFLFRIGSLLILAGAIGAFLSRRRLNEHAQAAAPVPAPSAPTVAIHRSLPTHSHAAHFVENSECPAERQQKKLVGK